MCAAKEVILVVRRSRRRIRRFLPLRQLLRVDAASFFDAYTCLGLPVQGSRSSSSRTLPLGSDLFIAARTELQKYQIRVVECAVDHRLARPGGFMDRLDDCSRYFLRRDGSALCLLFSIRISSLLHARTERTVARTMRVVLLAGRPSPPASRAAFYEPQCRPSISRFDLRHAHYGRAQDTSPAKKCTCLGLYIGLYNGPRAAGNLAVNARFAPFFLALPDIFCTLRQV